MSRLFYPKPGDTIVCENGETFNCVTYEDYPFKEAHPGKAIYGIGNRVGSHMNWKTHEANDVTEGDYAIREIISSAPQKTAIETKALCSVLRKAESKGTEALVDTMIEICDTQSGIMLQDLWEWWKKHKQKDQSTFDRQIKEHCDKRIQEIQDRANPVGDPNRITIVC